MHSQNLFINKTLLYLLIFYQMALHHNVCKKLDTEMFSLSKKENYCFFTFKKADLGP